jgi:hypothetical protein
LQLIVPPVLSIHWLNNGLHQHASLARLVAAALLEAFSHVPANCLSFNEILIKQHAKHVFPLQA